MSSAIEKTARRKPEIRLAQALSEFRKDLNEKQRVAFSTYQSKAEQSPPEMKDVMQFTATMDRRNCGGRCIGPRL